MNKATNYHLEVIPYFFLITDCHMMLSSKLKEVEKNAFPIIMLLIL